MNNSRAHFGNNQQCFFEVSDPLHSVQHFYLTCFAEHGDILLLKYFGLCCVLGCAMCIHYNSTILYSLQWGANAIIPNILCLKLCDLSFEASYCFSFGRTLSGCSDEGRVQSFQSKVCTIATLQWSHPSPTFTAGLTLTQKTCKPS